MTIMTRMSTFLAEPAT